ncbi:Hypothetical Protein FCC1311_061292 [Hondaea fermentalgiana]|uniref:FZ domain-containing protein n=1 Tax=Hondaea fermentalgiana TaxID=2315210 RepID=A0A2R5GHU8_9STRA|nr:Hypothetical Protein FCC1311_061292 [Hondaea fermentalgiana]|eukprot:GBG29909.1 Hypothetical Protein FCC1311_061292 [Hondaea fermentalgiana]
MEYPEEGGWCSEYGLGGQSVFVWEGTTMDDMETAVQARLEGLRLAASSISSQECLYHFFRVNCMGAFPLCDPTNDLPRRPCTEYCETIHNEYCASTFTIVSAAGGAGSVFLCSDTIGDAVPETSRSSGTGMLIEYLDGWNGESVFQDTFYMEDDGTEMECVSESGTSLACREAECAWGMTSRRYPIELNASTGFIEFEYPGNLSYCIESGDVESESHNATMDCDACISTCDIACPLPFIYDDVHYTFMWVMTWLPGFISFPLSVLIVVSEFKRVSKLKRRDITDRVVTFSGVICISLFFLDALPSAILAEDLRCNGYKTLNFRTNTYAHDFCEIGKIKPHLLQALLICVAITLYKVLRQLKASQNMSRYVPSKGFKILVPVLIVGVPLMLSIGTFAMEADQLYMTSYNYRLNEGGAAFEAMMFYPNLIRYAYSCGPLFESEMEELIFVQGPLLAIGLICVGLSFGLVAIVIKMSGSTGSMRRSATGASMKRGGGSSSKMLYNLAINMLRFAAISTILVILNAFATFMFLPKAKTFGTEVDKWIRCARTGINYDLVPEGEIPADYAVTNKTQAAVEANCGVLREAAPAFGLIMLQTVSQSLPTLCFGFIFALPALKQLKVISSAATSRKIRAIASSYKDNGGASKTSMGTEASERE